MKHINIPVPEERVEEVAAALNGLDSPCSRHGGKCCKLIVTLDECQWQLLQLVKLVGFGHIEMDVAEGRPTDLQHYLQIQGFSVEQNFRTPGDSLDRVRGLINIFGADGKTAPVVKQE